MARYLILIFIFSLLLSGCKNEPDHKVVVDYPVEVTKAEISLNKKVEEFALVELSADISKLTENQKQTLKYLIKSAQTLDSLFWIQAFGEKDSLMNHISGEDTVAFALINYGPWEMLNGNKPFIERYGKKPYGANLYPKDIKYLEFVAFENENKFSAYTLLQRDKNGELYVESYHESYHDKLKRIADMLIQASGKAEKISFKNYLKLKAEALLSDDYSECEKAWLNMKDNSLDIIIGPYETSEDEFLYTKAAYEAYVLLRDPDWKKQLEDIQKSIPDMKAVLPVDYLLKQNIICHKSELAVYDVLYCGGNANAGSKGISRSRPLDGSITRDYGDRKCIFQNITKAKFDEIVVPIGNVIIDESQRNHLKFDAFLLTSLFYVISDGIVIKQTINNKGTVKDVLKDNYKLIANLCSDIQRLYLIVKMKEKGILTELELMDYFVCYIVDLHRSIRFGTAHVQGTESVMRFNYFLKNGAIEKNPETGCYLINEEKMIKALEKLLKQVITIQGKGDYQAAEKLINKYNVVSKELQEDLKRIRQANIPRDVRFNQGINVLEF